MLIDCYQFYQDFEDTCVRLGFIQLEFLPIGDIIIEKISVFFTNNLLLSVLSDSLESPSYSKIVVMRK